jgi:uncharacterized protein
VPAAGWKRFIRRPPLRDKIAGECYLPALAAVVLPTALPLNGRTTVSAPPTVPAPVDPHAVQPPNRPWRWAQTWHDLFFAHWRVPASALRPHLPRALKIDTRDGSAWVSVAAFRLGVRLRWLPPLGLGTRFLELNLRTYVRCGDESGIYFLSIHAGKRTSVALARWLTPLPYAFAPLRYERTGTTWRLECQQPGGGTEAPLLDAVFTPAGPRQPVAGDGMDAWLLERYRAFVPDRRGRLYRMVVQHPAWQVQRTTVHVSGNRLGMPWGLALDRDPDEAHFAAGMRAVVWPFELITATG